MLTALQHVLRWNHTSNLFSVPMYFDHLCFFMKLRNGSFPSHRTCTENLANERSQRYHMWSKYRLEQCLPRALKARAKNVLAVLHGNISKMWKFPPQVLPYWLLYWLSQPAFTRIDLCIDLANHFSHVLTSYWLSQPFSKIVGFRIDFSYWFLHPRLACCMRPCIWQEEKSTKLYVAEQKRKQTLCSHRRSPIRW